MIAALFVTSGGAYYGLAGVTPWDRELDARRYQGPWPVVAHPPCERWGRFWHGSTRKPHQYRLGDDDGCFASALASVRRWGGVVEHPAHSHAWKAFGLIPPKVGQGWTLPDEWGGRSIYVEQSRHGHDARKPTWLYAVGIDFVDLDSTRGEQRIPQWMIDRYGYAKARRIGVVAMIGGKDKKRRREATPLAFRDLLLSLAATVSTRVKECAS